MEQDKIKHDPRFRMLKVMVERELERERPQEYERLKREQKLDHVTEAQALKAWEARKHTREQGLGIATALDRMYAKLLPDSEIVVEEAGQKSNKLLTVLFMPDIPIGTKNLREYAQAHPMQLGTVGMRSLLEQLQREYPDASIAGRTASIANVTKMEIQEHNRRRRIEVEKVLADPTKMALLDDVFATSDFKKLGSITLFRDVLRTLRRRQHKAERDTCQQALSLKRPHRPCRDRVSRTERDKED